MSADMRAPTPNNTSDKRHTGMIAWFAHNGVAANLLMVAIFALGAYSIYALLPQEVFPSITLDQITVRTAYPGATPSQVEAQITIEVENSVQDVDGIEAIRSRSIEGVSAVEVTLAPNTDPYQAARDMEARLNILALNENADKPEVDIRASNREVLSIAVSAPFAPMDLQRTAERLRAALLDATDITKVEIEGARPYELAIRINRDRLREAGLTMDGVIAAIRAHSGDFASGEVKTPWGDMLLRVAAQSTLPSEFEQILVTPQIPPDGTNGSTVRLGDIANITLGLADSTVYSRLNGQPSLFLDVYQTGDQSALNIASAAHAFVKNVGPRWEAEGVALTIWRDRSRILRARLDTLINNGVQGAILVFILLALFLRPQVALWVTIGIPISFMGAFALLALQGLTINLISLFAFIVVLGIVVDDAIVTGESIYARAKRCLKRNGQESNAKHSGITAAIEGTHAVAVPVTFGVLTTMAAFLPLFFMPGARGQIFAQIPAVVLPVLLFSLIESKFILPYHLSNLNMATPHGSWRFAPSVWLARVQNRIADGLEYTIRRFYQPLLHLALRWRYSTVTVFVVLLALAIVWMQSGHIRFVFFPRVPSEVVRANLNMPIGTPEAEMQRLVAHMTTQAEALQHQFTLADGTPIIENIMSYVRDDYARVVMETIPPELRANSTLTTRAMVGAWRASIGPISGAEALTFRAEIGRTSDPIDIQLVGDHLADLDVVSLDVRTKLATFPDVFDITDSLTSGKPEMHIALKPGAEVRGLTVRDVAAEIRRAFFGVEVQTFYEGREAVSVVLRYADDQTARIADVEALEIPVGNERIPIGHIADIRFEQSPATLYRTNRKRTVNITADVDKQAANVEAIKAEIERWFTATIAPTYPDIQLSLEGEAREQADTFARVKSSFVLVLLLIYALLAIPLKSYVQPFLVISVIPFGAIGALAGHELLGMDLSIMSILGMLALVGVLVNDSLVLVDYINQKKHALPILAAVRKAGGRRFRPVLLTSLTTFIGLMPLLLEESTQAKFLVPMAVSLGFGILFTTFITLLLVPCNYVILHDLKTYARRLRIVKISI